MLVVLVVVVEVGVGGLMAFFFFFLLLSREATEGRRGEVVGMLVAAVMVCVCVCVCVIECMNKGEEVRGMEAVADVTHELITT